MNLPVVIIKLYGPLIVFALLIITSIFLKKSASESSVTLNLLGLAQYKVPISNIAVLRMLIIISAFAILSLYIFYDYTKFFPKSFNMEVFFDEEGIKICLGDFTDKELRNMNIVDNYEEYQDIYYNDLDKELKKLLSLELFFTLKRGLIHSEGETTFIVEKIDGIQNYHISKSEGRLTHYLERPELKDIFFKSYFEKVNSKNDYLTPSLLDIYIKREVIVKPMFKQIIAENYKSNGVIFHHVLYGLTKIHFMPYPHYGNTIYLFKLENIGLIPIAYAIYM